ncbi:MAG TPA: diguanylate cyclase [Polyangiales bacterium]
MIRTSLFLLFVCLLLPVRASALDGQWYRAADSYNYAREVTLPRTGLTPVTTLSRTGGVYFYESTFDIPSTDTYVIDFKHSTTIGAFRHYVFDVEGTLIAERAGGISSPEENPFLLRHGRDIELPKGRYHLITRLDSPFLLAQPEPFVQVLREYRRDIKTGDALALLSIGMLCGLGLYYAVLASWRRRLADLMYVLFILGNVLYNGSALLLFPDLLGLHWFYLVSMPILFSNLAYVTFAMALLEITPHEHRQLYRATKLLLGFLACMAVVGVTLPNWSLEIDRYGVGLIMSYGLIAAVLRSRQGHASAQWYLVAISAFFVLGGASISLSRVAVPTLYVEHLGLLAVVVEAALLALVLAHQFSLLHTEKTLAERRAREGYHIAHRDALTGLPNRYSLDKSLNHLPPSGSLTFIELDGLKLYNDRFGHSKGDELLCKFSDELSEALGKRAQLYRLSGDEFAVTSDPGEIVFVANAVETVVKTLRTIGFTMASASFGSVLVSEDPSRENLKHIADTRMYENKRTRRASPPTDWTREAYLVQVASPDASDRLSRPR